uniref:Capping protein regulator and myosin 1 linker 3 n=1 Tax=Astyanax mexicanus TaxID=7994 RepID=A0A8B9HAD0_ASTMX
SQYQPVACTITVLRQATWNKPLANITLDLAVIVASMAYNTWFTKLYCKDLRLGSEVVEQVLHTISKSSSLEDLTLENAGLKADFPQKMAAALAENPASVLHSLNLAHNTLDNQGVSNLIQQVCRLSKGLRLLNLAKTSLSSKGVTSLSQALCSSDDYSNSLLHLDLSKNPGILSGEDATNLYLFLAQPNCLVHLDLSGTDCAVDSLFGALLRGCCADLSYLNLSKNSFSHRKVRETLPTFRQFFSSAFSLTHLNLSSMKMPPDVLRALFLGLSSNPHITDLHLDVSGCELRSAGAAVIQDLFPQVSCISTLDISDNGLDSDLLAALPAFSRHPSLKHLLLGKNFNVKGRYGAACADRCTETLRTEDTGLQSLSLADSRLRSRGTVLVNALGSNACLRKVDLSGNALEDTGARMLSKALQINTTLRSVTWDRNNTTATGFQDVARSLEHNFTLQYMPVPLSDVTQAYRSAPEKTEQAMTKIQRALLRNNQTQRFSQKQALRLHQGLVTSTAEQVMERLCVRVQQQVCVLRGTGEGEELQAARQVLKEARNSRALYPSLCELAHVLSVDGPVRQRLESLAGELAKAADKELQVIVDSMVSLCRELCPLSTAAAEQLSPPLSSISERVSIPRSAIRTALMERAAQDINRALEEVKLSVVSYLTNSVVDQILQELYATHKSLVLKHGTLVNLPRSGWPTEISPKGLGQLIQEVTKEPEQHLKNCRSHSPQLRSFLVLFCIQHSSENGGVNLLDDGLPDFYTKRVLPDSQLSSHHHAQALRRKKRRSVLSIFSGFRKNRNSASFQDSEPVGQSGACGDECRTNAATENVYSQVVHHKDSGGADPGQEGANGRLVGAQRTPQLRGRTIQGIPLPGMSGISPSCILQRQHSPEYSEVFCSSEEVSVASRDSSRPPDSQAEGQTPPVDRHAQSQDPDADADPGTASDSQPRESRQRPEPPPQSSKPSLAHTRQRHLEESSDKSTEDSEGGREGGDEKEERRCLQDQQRKTDGQTPKLPIPEKVFNVCYIRIYSSGKNKKPPKNDGPGELERSSDPKPPVKKPRLPPKRNKSLDFPGKKMSVFTVCTCHPKVCIHLPATFEFHTIIGHYRFNPKMLML